MLKGVYEYHLKWRKCSHVQLDTSTNSQVKSTNDTRGKKRALDTFQLVYAVTLSVQTQFFYPASFVVDKRIGKPANVSQLPDVPKKMLDLT